LNRNLGSFILRELAWIEVFHLAIFAPDQTQR